MTSAELSPTVTHVMQWLESTAFALIERTSVELPADVVRALDSAADAEREGSTARFALDAIRENTRLAAARARPLCQDTGSIHVFATLPHDAREDLFRHAFCRATAKATAQGILRQNTVDPLTGAIRSDNIGQGSPAFHIERHDRDFAEIRIILKGGGCENVSAQYSLPEDALNAHRDLDGIRRCVLDAVHRAQGMGCSPGIAGVCIGGDRASGYDFALRQMLRRLGEPSADPRLARLEERIVHEANELGIGPMGFGGNATLIGCMAGALDRLPASCYVSVRYMCWAFRRQGARICPAGTITEWLY